MKPGGHAGDGQVCSELPSPIYVSTCVSAASLMGQVLVELTGRSLRVYSRSRCEVVANFPVFDLLGLSACLPRLAIALHPCFLSVRPRQLPRPWLAEGLGVMVGLWWPLPWSLVARLGC